MLEISFGFEFGSDPKSYDAPLLVL